VQGNSVIGFKEKPSIAQAKKFFNSREYLWNAGMFCFNVSLLIQDLELHCKNIILETRKTLIKSQSSVIRNYSCLILDERLFSLVESKSIDYALIEKTSNLFVIPLAVGWSDLGSWEAMSETLKIQKDGNKFIGNCSFSKTKNTSIFAYSRHVALVGISDLFVVEMDDVILIVDKSTNLYTDLVIYSLTDYPPINFIPPPYNIIILGRCPNCPYCLDSPLIMLLVSNRNGHSQIRISP
jgi:mannose-1-phosphate guanylyltransferase